eukprot:TRINITY_DN13830_c0_g1_i1.p1 TRINITY_DN13830_c0_g1~~TRINITY_DN13830_c0_g1_i1.p1  ORF type:complete len:639 (+),score=143.90 TRINITY_DN13830_c0_g1_i1:25-1917(+)
MAGLTLAILCLLSVGIFSRTMTNIEKEELNQEYWRTVLDIFRADQSQDEAEAREFLSYYNDEKLRLLNGETVASWNYSTNITDHNNLLSQLAAGKYSVFESEANLLASRFDTSKFSDDIRRQFEKVGSKSLGLEEMAEMGELKSKMGEIYAKTKVCTDTNTCLNLEPGLTKIMGQSTNYTERLFAWESWRNEVGRKSKPFYERFIELKNAQSVLNGYADLGDEWRKRYETDSFEQDMEDIYRQMEPFYKELHAYVRRKLYDMYGGGYIDLTGPLPAHLLSDMWGRFWNNLYPLLEPYSGKPAIDPTEELKKQNYTVRKMFETADNFFGSMGLEKVPDTFWNLSMLEKPEGRDVICHATAWDFYDRKDYRIRMCTNDFNFEDFNTIHHELGHIQYFQQYKDLPVVYQEGANDGFHEAIGEMMAMVAATPKHLHKIGLIKELKQDAEVDINFLMSQALITISTLPFHLTNDLWRWRAFSGRIELDDWNDEFWKMKESIVGVKAPVLRTKEDLDPPSLYHINQDWDMMRYFTRTILQFQFAESLCKIAGHDGPLHQCDFSGSIEAGSALKNMLQLGSRRPWQDALESLTGERKMSAKPILKYFQPLQEWLVEKNKENGDLVGWNTSHGWSSYF